MGFLYRSALALSFGALLATTAHAQTYTTARDVYLRASPSKTGAKLRELAEGDTLPCPCIRVKTSVGKNHSMMSVPFTPSGCSRFWSVRPR